MRNDREVRIGDNTYALYSYNTLVGVLIEDRAYVTNRKYSPTTTKHINLWRKLRGIELPRYVSPDELQVLL